MAVPSAIAQTGPGVTAGASYERQLDRFAYRIENPSTFDTPLLVPHSFEPTYVADNHWLLGHVGYGGRRLRGRTQIGLAPAITTRGDDVDAFLQPGGDVVTSGTTGDVTLRSWRVDQRVDLTADSPVRWYAAYGYRRDAARFHEGHKAVTHIQPPSAERSIVTTRETTTSDVHEIRIGADLVGPPVARR